MASTRYRRCGRTGAEPLLLAVLLLILTGSAPAEAQPALPQLTLDGFPEAAREALAGALRAATERPTNAQAAGHLGQLLHAWEQWEEAEQAYARAHALAPATFEWSYLRGVVLQRLAQHEEAVASLRLAVMRDPSSLPARVRLAEALLDAGQLDESRTRFAALAAEPAAEPAAEVGLGRIAAAEGRHAEAVRHFERAIALFPELGAAHYGLARAYRALGRRADAERALERHAMYGTRWPRLPDPVLDRVTGLRDDARAVLQRGIALAEADDVEGAVAAHEDALARDPSLVQAHANLVSLYGRLGKWERAEHHYRATEAAALATADPHYDFAVVLSLQEKWSLAEEAYRKAIAINPLHAPAHNNLGQLLERRRDFAGARAEYERAVSARPAFRLARFNLARMLLALGDPHQAIAELEKIQEPRDAETPRYLFALATAHVRSGDLGRGRLLAEDARALAAELGQADLAAAIARELERLR